MSRLLEQHDTQVQQDGLLTNKNTTLGGTLAVTGAVTMASTLAVTGTTTLTGAVTTTAANNKVNAPLVTHTPTAVNSTATLTSAQVATGYITSTSAAAVTMTMPTGTLLGGVLGAAQGTVHELYIDNTAGANTVTVAVGANGILSDAATTTAASFGQLTIASGVTGVGRFTLIFSSATAYVFTRTA